MPAPDLPDPDLPDPDPSPRGAPDDGRPTPPLFDAGGSPLYAGVSYDYAAVAPAGATLFTAGACPLDPTGQVAAPGDHEAQAQVALDNLLAVLDGYGCGPEHLVRTTVYVVGERADLRRVWKVVAGGLAPQRPPSTLLGVSVLGYEHQLVEIDGIAALPS